MTLNRIQKIGIAFFISSLLPAYLLADWRYQANQTTITDRYEREQALHLSTDKLLDNCEKDQTNENTPYGVHHQICNQGTQEHAQTERAMGLLDQEKARNEVRMYQNFILFVLLFNLLGFVTYKASQFLAREEN